MTLSKHHFYESITVGGGTATPLVADSIDPGDYGNTYVVRNNGELTADRMAFIQSARSVTLDDAGQPALLGYQGKSPSLVVHHMADIANAAYAQDRLTLDFANGKHLTLTNLHIADPVYYSLTETPAGDMKITATAALRYGGPVYMSPPSPDGLGGHGHVWQL